MYTAYVSGYEECMNTISKLNNTVSGFTKFLTKQKEKYKSISWT